jgi:hypothetical protein
MADLGASFTREYEQKLLNYEQRIRELEMEVIKSTAGYQHAQALAIRGIELHYADYDLLVKLRKDIAHLQAETHQKGFAEPVTSSIPLYSFPRP